MDKKEYINRDFMKQLLTEEKLALTSTEVHPITLPNWPELKISAIMAIVKDDQ